MGHIETTSMKRIFIFILFYIKLLNAQNVEKQNQLLINVPDSGGIVINKVNISNSNITLKTLDSIFHARHFRSSFTHTGLAYFIYPKYRLRILCFVGSKENYPALIFLPIHLKEPSKIILVVNEISLSHYLTFDDIYSNPNFQSMIDKSYYQDPVQPNKNLMVMCNSNNICLELLFKKNFLDYVVVDINTSIIE